jgi:TPR repeat protein
MLGRFLMRGLGGEQDPAQAKLWLEKALAGGMAEANDDLAKLRVETGAAVA